MSIIIVFSQMVKLFIMMCLGYLLYKINIMDDHTRQHMTKFVLYVTTPTLIVYSFVQNLGDSNEGILGVLFAVAVGLYIILPVVAFVVSRMLRVKKTERGMYMFMTVFSNVGFMGFPVTEALYGAKGLFYVAVFNCMFNIFVFTAGICMVNYGNENDASFREMLSIKKILNPGILCCFVAIFLFILKIQLPELVMELLENIGGLTSPMAMILVGASLATMDVKEIFDNNIKMYLYVFIRQFIIPVISWPLVNCLISDKILAVVTLIMISMPIANTAVLFATEYKSNEKLAARTVFLTTVLALISIPFVLWLCVG